MNDETLRFECVREIGIIALAGPLDLPIIAGLKERIAAYLMQQPARLVVDIKEVSYIDSSGIGLLIFIAKLASEFKGVVKYVLPAGFVYDVLHMVHFDQLFEVYKSREKALKAFKD
jgi:anti-sigma B factor antagonist